jgi:hypothetical protein
MLVELKENKNSQKAIPLLDCNASCSRLLRRCRRRSKNREIRFCVGRVEMRNSQMQIPERSLLIITTTQRHYLESFLPQ